jgi:hypothetical protein
MHSQRSSTSTCAVTFTLYLDFITRTNDMYLSIYCLEKKLIKKKKVIHYYGTLVPLVSYLLPPLYVGTFNQKN